MASAASGRRRTSATRPRADLDTPPRSPIQTTPRPSISPLSARASPVAVRDTNAYNAQSLEATAMTQNLAMAAEVGDDDDGSSSLSEPEDVDDEDALPLTANATNAGKSELNTHQSLDVDSEAETERLDQTPDKARKLAENVGRTPSKLSHAATADDDLSEPPSPILPVVPGAASSTSTVEAGKQKECVADVALYTEQSPTGKKRKRSDTVDSSLTSADSDLGESPRKRSHSSAADDVGAEDRTATEQNADDATEIAEVPLSTEDPEADAHDTPVVSQAKVGRGRKGGQPKGKMKKDAMKDPEAEEAKLAETRPEEQSEEAVAKSAEELKHKQAASTSFEDLTRRFTAFREKICNEKLAAVEAEMELLNQPDCKHPEYLRQVACVDARKQKQVKESEAFYKFKLESLKRTTLAERSQLHSQYSQFIRDLRENTLEQLGEDWYNIQTERRQDHQKDDAFLYKFPTKKSDQIKQQAKYNQEVSVLSGFAKYVGFPAAPEINGIQGDSLEDDLKAMKVGGQSGSQHGSTLTYEQITKRAQQTVVQPAAFSLSNRNGLMEGQRERIAHDQFMEQNAWARPQGTIPQHGTPNLTHTPDWATEPGAHSSKLIRNASGGVIHGAGSPFATPMPQRRPAAEQSSSGTVAVNSDPVDPPSSVLAAPPTTDRLQHAHPGREQTSPLAVAKHRHNGAELTGYRNISGASTIDAPPDSGEREAAKEVLTGFSREAPAPQHLINTSQFHRNGMRPEVYVNSSFRPKEGAFGTPTPLPASNGAQ